LVLLELLIYPHNNKRKTISIIKTAIILVINDVEAECDNNDYHGTH